jgi:predicted naringenin-chalcone synthase
MAPVRIVSIGTAVPPYAYEQAEAKAIMQRWIGGERRVDRLLTRVYDQSGIERRFSVLPDFRPGAGAGLFRADGSDCVRRPGTAERNRQYAAAAPALLERAARRALAGAPAAYRDRVTHVVTVSCTGFQAPGIDDHLVRALRLPPTTERYHLGFMGCYAVFPALRMARAFCLADPGAVVLVAAVELCTLHLDPSRDVDSVVSCSVFADGAAAAVVSARDAAGAPSDQPGRGFEVLASGTTLTREGERDMAWTIGDHGFEMVLTSYVPRVIEAEIADAVAPLLHAGGVTLDQIGAWALHPGGRAILDKAERGLGLAPAALAASREVLASAGNMSSASVLFVLQRLLGGACDDAEAAGGGAGVVTPPRREAAPLGELVAALAFGPGLTVDAALMRVVDV